MNSPVVHLMLLINLSMSVPEEVKYRIKSIHGTYLWGHFLSNASGEAEVTVTSASGDCEHWYIREQWRTVELTPACSPNFSLRARADGTADLDHDQNFWAPIANNDGSWSFEHISERGGWLSADANGTVHVLNGLRNDSMHFWIDEWAGPVKAPEVAQTFCLQEERYPSAKYIGISMPNWRVGLADQCGPCGQFIIEYHEDQIALKEFCSGKYFAPLELKTPELQRKHRDREWPPFYIYVVFTDYTDDALWKPYKTGGLSFKSARGWLVRDRGQLTVDWKESYKATYSLTPYEGRGTTPTRTDDFTVSYCALAFLIIFGAPCSCLIYCNYKRRMLHRLLNSPLPVVPDSSETTRENDCEINHDYQGYSPYCKESGLLAHKEEIQTEHEGASRNFCADLETVS